MNGQDERAIHVLADRLVAAIEAGDSDSLRSLYSPQITCQVHTAASQPQTREEAVAAFASVRDHLTDVRVVVRNREMVRDGFVAQHLIGFRTPSGTLVELPACLICRIAEGRIVRLDEYYDSAVLAPMLQELGS